MVENFCDLVLYLSGILIAIVPLFKDISPKKFNNHPKLYRCFLIIASISLLFFGFKKTTNENDEKVALIKSIAHQSTCIVNLQNTINRHNKLQKEFEKRLETEFHIIKDTLTNRPINNTFNTSINYAERVDIGPH